MPTPRKPSALSESVARTISVAASCDPRTVKKLWAGGRVYPLVRDRILEALKARGLAVPG